MFSASESTIDTVKSWLIAHGIDSQRLQLSRGKNWLFVNATVAEAEDLLDTSYHVYEHSSGHEHIGK